MVNIPMNSSGAVDRNTIASIAEKRVDGAITSQNALSLNDYKKNSSGANPSRPPVTPVTPVQQTTPVAPVVQPAPAAPATQPAPVITSMTIPALTKTVQKGQKVPLATGQTVNQVKACLGWNVTNGACDVDVSAFLLNNTGKVLGDEWFVFYGQPESPDSSVVFSEDGSIDREIVSVDFTKINPSVSKIVFVLTINEALEKNLNFSMLKDAYIRIMDTSNNQELVSFKMTDYYANVTSMMIGEVYLHNNQWKFNAVGNGVAKDLAGLCDLYGVQLI